MDTTGRTTVMPLVVCLLAITIAGTAFVGGGIADERESSNFQTTIDADSIEMEPTIDASGDADWRVTYRLDLDGDEAIEGFEELQAEIEDDPSPYLDPFEERIQRTVESAETATEREMTVENFTVNTERIAQPDAEFGVVVFAFEWNGFAEVDDDGETVRAGDALDSLFLDDQTSLTIRWGDSHLLDSHTPQGSVVEENRLTWRGPQDFESGEPRAILVAAGESTPTDDDDATMNGDEESTDEGDDTGVANGDDEPTEDAVPSVPVLVAALGIALLLAALGLGLRRRQHTSQPAETEGESVSEQPSDSDTSRSPPPELLSNEERVLALVEEHGGRIKQKQVAETLDWSAARTSQVISTLREDEELETFRIGRENVVTLPDVDIVPNQDDESEDETDEENGDNTPGSEES